MLFDTSPHITLTSSQRRSHLIGRFCILLVALILSILFLYTVFFPESVLRYGYKNIDPLFRIVEPITQQDGNLTWSGAFTDKTDHITITIRSSKSLIGTELTLQKGFLAHMTNTATISDFPNARFDTQLPFPPGTLITGTRGHAVTNLSGSRQPIDSALTLRALGYTFENSQETALDEWGTYPKGSLLTIRSLHPSGTIFYEEDTDHTYLYTGESLTPTQSTEEQSRITVRSTSRTSYVNCSLVNKRIPRDTYTCTLPTGDVQDNPGKDYLFTLKDSRDIDISRITLTFTPKKSLANLRSRINSLREILKK